MELAAETYENKHLCKRRSSLTNENKLDVLFAMLWLSVIK